MVSLLERTVWYAGMIGLYGYGIYKFFNVQTSFNQKFHDGYVEQANRFVSFENSELLKFVDTKRKLLFLLGVDNGSKPKIVEQILEDFTPNYIVFERKLK
jgi:hypothetical protein